MENTILTDSIILRVSPEMKAALRALAKADNRKLGDFIRLLLAQSIEKGKPKK
jgi:hypothetical protein